MGLTKNFTDSGSSLEIEGAYFRIKNINYSPKLGVRFDVEMYLSKDSRDAGKSPIGLFSEKYSIDNDENESNYFDFYVSIQELDKSSKNIVRQCYFFLKERVDYFF